MIGLVVNYSVQKMDKVFTMRALGSKYNQSEGRPVEKKNCCSLDFVKNIDISDIQNNSLFKIPLKYRQNTCFVGHVHNLKNSLKFKLLAFWRK